MTDFLSLCCNKPVATVCGNEGTNHFVCTECDNACDVRSDTQEKWVELSKVESRNNLGQLEYSLDSLLLVHEIKRVIEEAKREVIQELKKDANDHLESSENEEISNFWIDVHAWLVLKQSDSLTSKEGEERKE